MSKKNELRNTIEDVDPHITEWANTDITDAELVLTGYIANQRTLIFHIQGVFNLPGRCFRQRVTLTSSVPMTLNPYEQV